MTRWGAREEVTDNLINLLRAKLTDPAAATRPGTNKNWIYPDFPRPDAFTPRISLVRLPGAKTEERVSGNRMRIIGLMMQIDVWVHTDDKYTIGGNEFQGEKLLTYLCDQVDGVLQQYRSTLTYGGMPRIASIQIIGPAKPLHTDVDMKMLRDAITIMVWRAQSIDYTDLRIKYWDEVVAFTMATRNYALAQSTPYQVDRVSGYLDSVAHEFIPGTDFIVSAAQLEMASDVITPTILPVTDPQYMTQNTTHLFISCGNDAKVLKVNKTTKAVDATYALTPGCQPKGLAFDATGNLWVCCFSSAKIAKITSLGAITYYNTGGFQPWEIVFDATNTLMWVTFKGDNKVQSFNAAGAVVDTLAITGPHSVEIDTSTGFLFVTGSTSGKVSKINTTTKTITTYTAPGTAPLLGGIKLDDAGGSLWMCEQSIHGFLEMTQAGVFASHVTPSPAYAPEWLQIDGPGGYIWYPYTGGVGCYRRNADVSNLISLPGQCVYLIIDSLNGPIWAIDITNHTLNHLSYATMPDEGSDMTVDYRISRS